MSNWKSGKKSYSVNDIPVQNSTKQIIHSLDDGDFCELLQRVSKPTYNRASSGCLELAGDRNRETSNLIQVCEKNLRDEDAARVEEQRRLERESNRNRNEVVLAMSRSPSPSERTSTSSSIPSKPFEADANIEFIDSGDGDVEMTDLSGMGNVKKFTKGNQEKVAMDLTVSESTTESTKTSWDQELAESGGYFLDRTPEGFNKEEEAHRHESQWKIPAATNGEVRGKFESAVGDDLVGSRDRHRYRLCNMPARRERGLFTEEPASYLPKEELDRLWNLELNEEDVSSEHSSRESLEESSELVSSSNFSKSPCRCGSPILRKDHHSYGEDLAKNGVRRSSTGVMSETSDCFTEDSISSFESPSPVDTGKTENAVVKCIFPLQYLIDCNRKTYMNSGDGIKSYDKLSIDSNPVNIKVEEKKRKRNKKRASSHTFTVPKNDPDYMGNLPVEQLVALIEGSKAENKTKKDLGANDDASRKEKRRKSKDLKKEENVLTVTIGNHQAKAPAAAPEDQPPIADVKKDSAKVKSPKRRKNSNNVMTTAPRTGGRLSTEEAEEEFLSADEGVVSSNSDDPVAVTSSLSSEVMMDGANYRADDEDLTNLEKHVAEEEEFITVSARTKKKGTPTHQQTMRTGSTGKVERRVGIQKTETQRRNSFDERAKPGQRRLAGTPFSEFLDDCKTENRAHVKMVPFKDNKGTNKERLDSAADSDFQDAVTDEMVNTQNGSPASKGFSYADAAKKSSEQSRENSPSCVAQPVASISSSPSPSPTANDQTATASPTVDHKSPVMVTSADKEHSDGLSFFYDNDQETPNSPDASNPNRADDGAFVLNLGGKTVRFAKGMAAPVSEQLLDNRQLSMLDNLRQRWEEFHKGSRPVVYTPGM